MDVDGGAGSYLRFINTPAAAATFCLLFSLLVSFHCPCFLYILSLSLSVDSAASFNLFTAIILIDTS